MGYALFTARKLSLNARVNNLNAQLMTISNQRDSLTRQIAAKQNAANLRTAQAKADAANVFSQALESDSSTEARTKAENDYNKTIADNEVLNSISNFEIAALEAQDNVLDNSQQSIQTRLTAAQKELESVEKAEESGIKNASPKYSS